MLSLNLLLKKLNQFLFTDVILPTLLNSASIFLFTKLKLSVPNNWRRKWQPTPVFLPRESHGQRSLVGCCPQGLIESDTTEATWHACMHWRRKWQPTPIFLSGESQRQKILVGCCLWGHTESDMTEATQHGLITESTPRTWITLPPESAVNTQITQTVI